jgi:hypothetical protein
MNYEKDLKIDDSALDIEILSQPELMMKYCIHAAEARKNLEEVKQTVDVIKAELDKSIREKPEDYNITKITEGAIQSAILTDERYCNIYQEFLNAKYESDMAGGAVRAMEQKKDCLELLVRLHGQSYFAGPKVPRNLEIERQKRLKQQEQSSKLTRDK